MIVFSRPKTNLPKENRWEQKSIPRCSFWNRKTRSPRDNHWKYHQKRRSNAATLLQEKTSEDGILVGVYIATLGPIGRPLLTWINDQDQGSHGLDIRIDPTVPSRRSETINEHTIRKRSHVGLKLFEQRTTSLTDLERYTKQANQLAYRST